MAIPITIGVGNASIAGETVGGITYQQIEVYGKGGASVLSINPDGSVKASIIGIPAVTFSGAPSISGAVTVVGTPSISGTVIVSNLQGASVSGTVGASVIGYVPVSVMGGFIGISGTPQIMGTVASGTADGGNPVKVGGQAQTTEISSVVTGARVNAVYDVVGKQIVMPYANKENFVSGSPSVITATASVLVLPAPSGTQRNYVTHLLVTNGSAVATTVNIVDNGLVIYSGYCAASGGGFSTSFPVPLKQPTSVLALYAASSAVASVFVSASGYTGT